MNRQRQWLAVWAMLVAGAVAQVALAEEVSMNNGPIHVTVELEEVVYSNRYSNNGSTPIHHFNSTSVVRQGDKVFVGGYERMPRAAPLEDCRWALWQRMAGGWERVQADETGLQREPCPLVALPGGRVLLSSQPLRVEGDVRRQMPEFVIFDSAASKDPPNVCLPVWSIKIPPSGTHTYRNLVADAGTGEAFLCQNDGVNGFLWTLMKADGGWLNGRELFPAIEKTELEPYGAGRARVNYPVVALKNRAVHFCGQAAYDNWDRVKTLADLGVPPNARSGGFKTRERGNRFRRLWYTWTPAVGEKPFSEWLEIDNTFDDGGWLFATDMHVAEDGTVHLLWFRFPLLPSVRDQYYPDIKRVYRIEYATLREGKVLTRRTLLTAGEGHDPAVPTDLNQVGRPYNFGGTVILGDPTPMQRFHFTPDGRMFLVYYVSDGKDISENRIIEIASDGTPSAPVTIPLKHPLTQFFLAGPRAGCAPSWTLDMLGFRRGGWEPANKAFTKWDGEISYAQVRIRP